MARAPDAAPTLTLSSSAFTDGDPIPRRHTCDGEDLSPPLRWSDGPSGTRSFALICDDPDAPRGVWVHWVLYNLPADARELTEGVPPEPALPSGARQGVNDFGRHGYGGPCPPPGPPHRYFFWLYAVDTALSLPDRASKSDLLRAIEGHILGTGLLMGTYERSARRAGGQSG